MKLFYDHLIVREEIEIELAKVSSEEREELLRLIEEHLDHRILDVILTHLPKTKHENFLTKFHQAPHDKKLLDYLKKEIEADIEEKIRAEGEAVKKEILAEIKRAKKN